MTNDAEHLCICLFATCISSWVKSVQITCPIFYLAVFLLFSFEVFMCLHILDTSVLSDMGFENIFSQCVASINIFS